MVAVLGDFMAEKKKAERLRKSRSRKGVRSRNLVFENGMAGLRRMVPDGCQGPGCSDLS